MFKCLKKRVVRIGNVKIGGNNPIAIQTMTTAKTSNIKNTLKQIYEYANAGANLVRVSIFDMDDAIALRQICKKSPIPIIADIHYVWQYAIYALNNGAAKVRINPGNLFNKQHILKIIACAKKNKAAIRIGINTGSLKINKSQSIVKQLVDCAIRWINFFEINNFHDLVISIKDSNTQITTNANLKLAKKSLYPIHIGLTEAGPDEFAIVKSCIAISPLLAKGIGNTIRLSLLTSNKIKEIKIAKILLKSFQLAHYYDIVACPLCGRNKYNTEKWVNEIDNFLQDKKWAKKIAIMGCNVNAYGEAQNAAITIYVKNKDISCLYMNGKYIKDIKNNNVVKTIKRLILSKKI